MSGITTALNIAKDALLTHQMAMEVTGHNIANVNTPGYSRQRALLESVAPSSTDLLKMGTGVQIAAVVQSFDQFATRAIRQNASTLAENETKAMVLSNVESIFNEASGLGLSAVLNEFWNAWQDLANNPGGIPERTALLEKAEVLSKRFNTMSDNLRQIIRDMNQNLREALGEMNQTTAQIASLNVEIVAQESSGTVANDLRDHRNSLLEKLSSFMGIQCFEEENGSLAVMTSNGYLLVDGNQSSTLTQEGDQIFLGQGREDLSPTLTGGKIGAWLDIRDEIGPQYLANLDELAGTLIAEVNAQHLAGYALSGADRLYFFEDFPSAPGTYTGAASFMKLSSDVRGNPGNIAAGGQSGAPGDNENALQILNIPLDNTLQIRKWTYGDRGLIFSNVVQREALDDFYRTIVGDIGILSGGVSLNRDFAQSTLNYLNEARDSVSGVNLDEEMAELLKIQRAYEAAAKLITVVDEMLQTLVNII